VTDRDGTKAREAFQALVEAVGGIEGLHAMAVQERARVARVDAHRQREQQARERAARLGVRRCSGKTKAGQRCTRPAGSGAKRCHQHQKGPSFTRSDRNRAKVACEWHVSPSRARRSQEP
jgi:hypothetical protein